MNSKHGSLSHHVHHAAHHFLVALTLASVVLIFEYHGMLNWLDSVSLRAVSTLGPVAEGTAELDGSDTPLQLLIADEFYETSFRQESPLDRRELTMLIGAIAKGNPSVLAIDLDLSPGPAGALGNAGQEDLDALLVQLASKDRLPVIVTTPFPVVTDALLQYKYRWLQAMCQAGVRVAYPHIVLTQGLVMRYAHRQPTLGFVASAAADVAKDTRQVGGDLCGEVMAGVEKSLFLSKAFASAPHGAADDLRQQRPLNPEYLRNSARLTQMIKSGNTAFPDIAGRPVFLGSQYDARDEFLTPYGPMKGTSIHAATFFSERRPTQPVAHGVAVVLDLVFGVAAGFLFGAVWKRTNEATAALSASEVTVRRWLHARGWLFVAFGLLLLWLAMLFYGSAWLLSHDLWNNPGPMIVGVFVKTLLASRLGLRTESPRGHNEAHGARRTLLNNLDWLVLSPFVIWAAVLLLGH
jgi:hypothetical protein